MKIKIFSIKAFSFNHKRGQIEIQYEAKNNRKFKEQEGKVSFNASLKKKTLLL